MRAVEALGFIRRERHIILPEYIVRQALFVDSKAEKTNRTATIQMSQTSMKVKQTRAGNVVDESGLLPQISLYDNQEYLTTTAFIHFMYEDIGLSHFLREATIFCLPNGILQEQYNSTVEDTIWLVGRNAPTLGEDFRVRLGFSRLAQKAAWRVQKIFYVPDERLCIGNWRDQQ